MITLVTQVKDIDYTADDWELYDTPTRDATALALNRAFKDAVNREGSNRHSVSLVMYSLQKAHKSDGALDSEATRLIDRLLDQIYGDRG